MGEIDYGSHFQRMLAIDSKHGLVETIECIHSPVETVLATLEVLTELAISSTWTQEDDNNITYGPNGDSPMYEIGYVVGTDIYIYTSASGARVRVGDKMFVANNADMPSEISTNLTEAAEEITRLRAIHGDVID